MKYPVRFATVSLLVFSAVTGFSQQTNPRQEKKTHVASPAEATIEEPRTNGLRRLTNNRNWDFEVNIDQEALEASIESAIERAMNEVEAAMESLEKLEIHLEPIEINLSALENLDINIEPIVIDIGDLDIDVDIEIDEPEDLDIDIDLDPVDDLDIDMDEADFDRIENEEDDEDANRKTGLKNLSTDPDKEKVKEKSDKSKEKGSKEDKNKAKGLRKIG